MSKNKYAKAARKRASKKYGARCAFCGSTRGLTLDHITPKSKGGSKRNPQNHQLLCRRCNSFKGSMDDSEAKKLFKQMRSKTWQPCHNIRPIGGRIEHEKLAVGGEVINKNVEGV